MNKDGVVALQRLTQVNPDVVILDIEMPEMDGLTALAELRKTHRRLPVIMFSSLTERGATATLDALALGASDYFTKRPPKSLDRNSFVHLNLNGLNLEDGAATLTAFTVHSIARAAAWFHEPVKTWIICGGGRHNATIMAGLREILPNVQSAEQAGFNGDAMEAEAWAYLAVRSLKKLPISFPGTTGVKRELTGGVLAIPHASRLRQ